MAHTPAASGETVLKTDRLLLRRRSPSDAAMLRRLWLERDPRVPPHRQMSSDGHPSLSDLEDGIRRDDPSTPLGLLAVAPKGTGVAVGYCGLIPNVHGQDGEPEIAYEFLRDQWGQGLATEAAHAVIGWAESLGYIRLWATIRDWNGASRRVVTKLGFAQTSRIEPDARYGDTLFYRKELDHDR